LVEGSKRARLKKFLDGEEFFTAEIEAQDEN
jgi:hypothetical protein